MGYCADAMDAFVRMTASNKSPKRRLTVRPATICVLVIFFTSPFPAALADAVRVKKVPLVGGPDALPGTPGHARASSKLLGSIHKQRPKGQVVLDRVLTEHPGGSSIRPSHT